MKRKRIYLSPPHMGGEELKFVKRVFEENWIAPIGPDVDAFEKELCEYNDSKYAVALSTGTSAIHLAFRILKVQKGDEVFCSSLTFFASATPAVYEGARPVFIDSDETSWNMNPGLLDEELKICVKKNKLPKVVIVTHLYGQSANMDSIINSCNKYDIPVIEDAAEALGALYKGKKVGNFGYAGIFSFNGNKIITTSSGGMLVSKDDKLIDKARFLSTQARDKAPHYQHSEIGFNYRMSNVLAAIGRGQLKVIDKRVKRRREIFDLYKEHLGNIPGITFMPEPGWSHGNRWLTCILVDAEKFGRNSEDIRLKLEEYNIESRPIWKPMHLQPVFKGCRVVGGNVSAKMFKDGLCLPSGTAMRDKDIEFVCDIVKGMGKS